MLLCHILSRIDILKFQINFCSQKLEKESHFSFLFLKVNFAGLVWSGTARTRISMSCQGAGQWPAFDSSAPYHRFSHRPCPANATLLLPLSSSRRQFLHDVLITFSFMPQEFVSISHSGEVPT